MEKELLSTIEAAKLLGISRIAVFKKIRAGEIKAKKAGRNYVIRRKDLLGASGAALSAEQERGIESAVKKTVREYGEALRLLGRE